MKRFLTGFDWSNLGHGGNTNWMRHRNEENRRKEEERKKAQMAQLTWG